MDMNAVLQEIETWPVADQIRLVEQLTERISEHAHDDELSDEFKMELQRRIHEIDNRPERAVSWSEVKANVVRHVQPPLSRSLKYDANP